MLTKTEEIIDELNEVITKLKCRLIYYQTENKKLKEKIAELKKFVREN
tara:strand:+ start:27 stop:170 length:144 start_codon:yes stop_codon:yes gene_type:complete